MIKQQYAIVEFMPKDRITMTNQYCKKGQLTFMNYVTLSLGVDYEYETSCYFI